MIWTQLIKSIHLQLHLSQDSRPRKNHLPEDYEKWLSSQYTDNYFTWKSFVKNCVSSRSERMPLINVGVFPFNNYNWFSNNVICQKLLLYRRAEIVVAIFSTQ